MKSQDEDHSVQSEDEQEAGVVMRINFRNNFVKAEVGYCLATAYYKVHNCTSCRLRFYCCRILRAKLPIM